MYCDLALSKALNASSQLPTPVPVSEATLGVCFALTLVQPFLWFHSVRTKQKLGSLGGLFHQSLVTQDSPCAQAANCQADVLRVDVQGDQWLGLTNWSAS